MPFFLVSISEMSTKSGQMTLTLMLSSLSWVLSIPPNYNNNNYNYNKTITNNNGTPSTSANISESDGISIESFTVNKEGSQFVFRLIRVIFKVGTNSDNSSKYYVTVSFSSANKTIVFTSYMSLFLVLARKRPSTSIIEKRGKKRTLDSYKEKETLNFKLEEILSECSKNKELLMKVYSLIKNNAASFVTADAFSSYEFTSDSTDEHQYDE